MTANENIKVLIVNEEQMLIDRLNPIPTNGKDIELFGD